MLGTDRKVQVRGMKCPACGHKFPNPTAQAGGRAGGAKGLHADFSRPICERIGCQRTISHASKAWQKRARHERQGMIFYTIKCLAVLSACALVALAWLAAV